MAQAPEDLRRVARRSASRPTVQVATASTTTARPAAFWSNPPPASQFDDRLQRIRQLRPERLMTITRGGQTYREIDNGIANVLVPTLDPSASRLDIAENRAAIERARYMADNPLAGAAYGFATLAGVPPRQRNTAMVIGGIADAIIGSRVPRTVPVKRPSPPKQGQAAGPGLQRPNYRPSELNAMGQATRVEATAIASMLGTGSKAKQKIRPPDFVSGLAPYFHARGHLFPRELGDPGDDPRNIVTLSQRPTNDPHMSSFDKIVARKVRSGEVIEYSSTPIYTPGVGAPGAILMTASGSGGTRMAKVVVNPAGRRR